MGISMIVYFLLFPIEKRAYVEVVELTQVTQRVRAAVSVGSN